MSWTSDDKIEVWIFVTAVVLILMVGRFECGQGDLRRRIDNLEMYDEARSMMYGVVLGETLDRSIEHIGMQKEVDETKTSVSQLHRRELLPEHPDK